jgi:hypothetical protein
VNPDILAVLSSGSVAEVPAQEVPGVTFFNSEPDIVRELEYDFPSEAVPTCSQSLEDAAAA